VRRRGMRALVEATVRDATGTMRATFFNQPWLVERYPPGTRLLLHGKADARGGFNVSHHAPSSELGAPAGSRPDAGGEVAHYPASDGISSTQILTLVRESRDALDEVVEVLAAATRVSEGLPDRASALAAMHFPHAPGDLERGRRRLAYEELLLAQLVFLRRRAAEIPVVSVCTGGLILAASGVLDGKTATTKREVVPPERSPLDQLREDYPDIMACEASLVDEGSVITGGGVSLCIDTMLYLLERLFGQDVAAETARIIEYQRAWAANLKEFPPLVAAKR